MVNDFPLPEPVVKIVGTITRQDGSVEGFEATTEKGQGGPGNGDHTDDSGEECSSGCDS